MQFQTCTHNDDRAGRIIDTLTKQVFAKSSLLTFDHVSQRFKRTVATSQYRSLTTVVVEKRIDGLLKHSFFVADDDLGSVEVNQFSQTIVSIDDTTIKIIKIGSRKVARVEQDQRT